MADPPPPYPGEKSGMDPNAPPPAAYPPPGAPPPGQPYPGQPGPYGPPPPGAYPPAGAPPPATAAPVTVVGPATVVGAPNYCGGTSARVTCQHCHSVVQTGTQTQSGLLTWLIAGLLCIVGCWCCCCIPFCVDDLQDVVHVCPNCHKQISVYKRMS